jgi:hypothetical protein
MKDAPTLSMGARLTFRLEQWERLFRLVLISEKTPASRYVKHPLVVFSVSSILGHVLAFGGPVPEFLGGGGVAIAFPLIRHIRARQPYQQSPWVAHLFLEARLDGRGRVAEATHRFGEAVIADAEFLPPIRELVIGRADQIDVLRGGFRLVVGHGMILVGAASR